MRELSTQLREVWASGRSAALATVVETFNSAPRPPGAVMLVSDEGDVSGSVSGGCVEAAVYQAGEEVISSGAPQLERYGVSDDDVFSIGVTCGGTLEVFVERISATEFPQLGDVTDRINAGDPVAVATVIEHHDPQRVGQRVVVRPNKAPEFTPGWAETPVARMVADDVLGLLEAGRTTVLEYGHNDRRQGKGQRIFVRSFAPRPRMVVFGAIDFSAAVARIGSFLGYHVTVCDARPLFATAKRFPNVEEVLVRWPHEYLQEQINAHRVDERTALCVLTHDPKFDIPLLQTALTGPPVAYIGAMGSRRTHEKREYQLRQEGLTEEQLARLSSPIGLDLGGRTPEETAVSIAAEIIARRKSGTGKSLSGLKGPIHAV